MSMITTLKYDLYEFIHLYETSSVNLYEPWIRVMGYELTDCTLVTLKF